MDPFVSRYDSPIGSLRIVGTKRHILEIEFTENPVAPDGRLPACIRACQKQLDQYFRGKRKDFDLPLAPAGTEFQLAVWRELEKIPYGAAVSYGDIAARVGNPKAGRAVGGANHDNPISIVIPCHRVIGAGGHLTGYGGALWRKQWLLLHEKAVFGNGDKSIRYSSPLPGPPG